MNAKRITECDLPVSLQENREDTYKRIRKRLRDYKYRSSFFTLGALVFAVLFIFSIVPLVPSMVAEVLGLLYSAWGVLLWFLFVGVFGILFWVFQKFARRIEGKRGITLEEKLYVPAYEALCFLKEYLNPNHPVLSSRIKAVRRLQNLEDILGVTGLPNMSIIEEQIVQLSQLRGNLSYRVIPSIKNVPGRGTKLMETLYSAVEELVDYLSRPELAGLIALNQRMSSLPETTKKGMFEYFASAIFRRSNLRHTAVFSIFALFALFTYYVDINCFGATINAAFELGLMFFVGMAAIYVTYLGLTVRRGS